MNEYRMIDVKKWSRYETFRRFYDEVSCSVSMCDDIDVTSLKSACERGGRSFYISVLYSVAHVVNSHDEFRLFTVDSPEYPAPMPAVWESLNPVHNIFHGDDESYSSIFTLWSGDYDKFYAYASDDIARIKRSKIRSVPSGGNIFEASCVPWRHFTSVEMACADYPLSPVVVWGKYAERDGRTLMPLSIQISHAACDGFHLARFINEVERTAADVAQLIK